MSLDEWIKIGQQSQKARNEVINLLKLTDGKIPVGINDVLLKVLDQIDKYRCKAESRMFETGVDGDLNVFFGGEITLGEGGKTSSE